MATRIPRGGSDDAPATAQLRNATPRRDALRRAPARAAADSRDVEVEEPLAAVPTRAQRAMRASRANARAAAAAPAGRASRTVVIRPDIDLDQDTDDEYDDEPAAVTEPAYDDEVGYADDEADDETEDDEADEADDDEAEDDEAEDDETDETDEVEDATVEYDDEDYDEEEGDPVFAAADTDDEDYDEEPPVAVASNGRRAAPSSVRAAPSRGPARRPTPPPPPPPARRAAPAAPERLVAAKPLPAPIAVVPVIAAPEGGKDPGGKDPGGKDAGGQDAGGRSSRQRPSLASVGVVGRDVLDKVGLVVQLVALVCFLVLAIHVLFVASDANVNNSIVSWFDRRANGLVGAFKNIFTAKSAKTRVFENYGLAAVVYLLVGAVVRRVLRK